MASQTIIDLQLLQREMGRFCSRIGMEGLPQIDGQHALVFNSQGARLSVELDATQTKILISYAVKPEISETESMLRKALELTFYKGGYILNVMFVDPYLILMTKLNNADISAESIEGVMLQLIRLWEEIRHGY